MTQLNDEFYSVGDNTNREQHDICIRFIILMHTCYQYRNFEMAHEIGNINKLSEPQMKADEMMYMIYFHHSNHLIMGISGSDIFSLSKMFFTFDFFYHFVYIKAGEVNTETSGLLDNYSRLYDKMFPRVFGGLMLCVI